VHCAAGGKAVSLLRVAPDLKEFTGCASTGPQLTVRESESVYSIMPNATVFDVASLAGVSIKTVSRVVNQEPHVRPATKERVDDAIAALDYRPDESARKLARHRASRHG